MINDIINMWDIEPVIHLKVQDSIRTLMWTSKWTSFSSTLVDDSIFSQLYFPRLYHCAFNHDTLITFSNSRPTWLFYSILIIDLHLHGFTFHSLHWVGTLHLWSSRPTLFFTSLDAMRLLIMKALRFTSTDLFGEPKAIARSKALVGSLSRKRKKLHNKTIFVTRVLSHPTPSLCASQT